MFDNPTLLVLRGLQFFGCVPFGFRNGKLCFRWASFQFVKFLFVSVFSYVCFAFFIHMLITYVAR